MSRAERVETALLVVILLVVGVASFAVSYSHVAAWTMANLPAGTPDVYGYVNATITELVPLAALLEVRRRRRAGKGVGYPLALLFGAAGLSLAAQLAVAVQTPAGWLLSAVPMLAFTALTKLVLSGKPAPARPAPASVPPVATPATARPHASPAAPVQVSAVATVAPARPYPAPVPPGAALLPIAPVATPGAGDGGTTPPAPDTMAAPVPTAARVAAAVAEQPDATPAQIAARLLVSERTVRRYLPAPRAGQRADRAPTRRRTRGAVPAVAAG
ncbi:hypothetical protein [Plantactinospora sp. WMMB782]|uniref:hypothetical protein n=1 Tax=Plantactinospora sp. WMMB782 TaxID=3404121 RepID=UPI003B9250E5